MFYLTRRMYKYILNWHIIQITGNIILMYYKHENYNKWKSNSILLYFTHVVCWISGLLYSSLMMVYVRRLINIEFVLECYCYGTIHV